MSEQFQSVWDAIEETPGEAENMKLRSAFAMALDEYITREGLTQAQAADILGVTQPRISDLVRGKINVFSLDALVNMLAKAGLHIDARIRPAA